MAELSGQQTATDGAERSANINVTELMFGAQRLMLGEIAFAGNEWIDRARTETHLFSEFISKVAGAHSVNGLRTMYQECGQHQVDFIRRDATACSGTENASLKLPQGCLTASRALRFWCAGRQQEIPIKIGCDLSTRRQ